MKNKDFRDFSIFSKKWNILEGNGLFGDFKITGSHILPKNTYAKFQPNSSTSLENKNPLFSIWSSQKKLIRYTIDGQPIPTTCRKARTEVGGSNILNGRPGLPASPTKMAVPMHNRPPFVQTSRLCQFLSNFFIF